MTNTYVVIDLETTGLDCNTDKIIEIAAVKVKRGLIIDEFSSLVAIDGSLPEEISSLTGISDEMLLGQPRIEDLIPALSDFIGEADIVAHKAEFDSSFLLRYWPDPRTWIDSITLAQIAYPCQPSYALAWLVKNLELENHSAHRALADALATAELLIRIEKELSGFPDFLQEQLSALASGDESATGAFIRRCCSGRGGAAAPAGQTVRGSHQRREINEEYCLDVDALADYFGERAEFKERIPGFEERPQQLQLAQEVARTLNNGGCLLAEAGTGTGKSLAYLLPAALYARGSGKLCQTTALVFRKRVQPGQINQHQTVVSARFVYGRGKLIRLRRRLQVRFQNAGKQAQLSIGAGTHAVGADKSAGKTFHLCH